LTCPQAAEHHQRRGIEAFVPELLLELRGKEIRRRL
jgi:hypothetical protein